MKEYAEETIQELDKWFEDQKARGFTAEDIKKSLINNGYDKEFIDDFIFRKTVKQESTEEAGDIRPDTPGKQEKTNSGNPWLDDGASKKEKATPLSEEEKTGKFSSYSYMDKMKLIIKNPGQFFDEMPTTGGYKGPVVFACINFVLFIAIELICVFLGLSPGLTSMDRSSSLLIMFLPFILVIAVLELIGSVVSIFVSAALNYVFFRLFKGQGTYQAIVRVFSYATVVLPLAAIPIAGFLASIYLIYVIILGLSKIHKMSMAKTMGVLVVIGFVVLVLSVILAALAVNIISSIMTPLSSDISAMIPAAQ